MAGLGVPSRLLLGLGAAAVGALAYATVVERNAFTVRRVRASVLEPGSDPIRVLHMSDIHFAPLQNRKSEWLQSLVDLHPDLIVNTGDNLGHVDALEILTKTFDAFKGIPGVFVNGSNDYFAPEFKNPFSYFMGPSQAKSVATRLNTPSLMSYFENDLQWTNLNNTAADITVQGQRIVAMGVDDPHRRFDSLSKMSRALSDVDTDTAALTIGVTHAPYQRILNSFVSHGAELIFAGHTHGGQVCVPGYGALVTNCDIPRRQAKGLSTWQHDGHNAALNVSAGVGTSIFAPVRFSCRPEVTLLELTS